MATKSSSFKLSTLPVQPKVKPILLILSFFVFGNSSLSPPLVMRGTKSGLLCHRTPIIQLYCIVDHRVTYGMNLIKVLHYIALHFFALQCIASHCIASHRIASHRIVSYRIVSYRMVSHRIALYFVYKKALILFPWPYIFRLKKYRGLFFLAGFGNFGN